MGFSKTWGNKGSFINIRGYSITETMVSLGIVAVVVAGVAYSLYSGRHTRTLEEAKQELLDLNKAIITRMTDDVSHAPRVTGHSSLRFQINQSNPATPSSNNGFAGVSNYPLINTDRRDEDGFSILREKFGNFSLAVDVSANQVRFTSDSDTSQGRLVYQYFKRAASNHPLFIVSNVEYKNVFYQNLSPDANDTATTLTLASTAPTVDLGNYSERLNSMRVAETVVYRRDGSQLVREIRNHPAEPRSVAPIEKIKLADQIQDFQIFYSFGNFRGTNSRPRGAGLQVSTIHEIDCANLSTSEFCPEWRDLDRIHIEMTLVSSKKVNGESAAAAALPPGFTIRDGRLIYKSKFRLAPFTFGGLENQTSVTGEDFSCSPHDLRSRCNWQCANAFRGTNPSADDWAEYGKPAFLQDGNVNPDASDYCICGTNRQTKQFVAPETAAGHSQPQLARWTAGATENNKQTNACARHFNACLTMWVRFSHSPSYQACTCVTPNAQFYATNNYSTGTRGYDGDEIKNPAGGLVDIFLLHTPAYANYRTCYFGTGCFEGMQQLHGNTLTVTDPWMDSSQDNCGCATQTKAPWNPNQLVPPHGSTFDWKKICNLEQAADPSAALSCPNTFDGTNLILRAPNAALSEQGLDQYQANVCACLRGRDLNGTMITQMQSRVPNWPNVAPVVHDNGQNWDFRNGEEIFAYTNNPAHQNANHTFGAVGSLWVDYRFKNSGDTTSSQTRAYCTTAVNAWMESIGYPVKTVSRCGTVTPDAETTTAMMNLPTGWRQDHAGYCSSRCGATYAQSSIAEVNAVRHAITNTADSSPLPDWCGGTSGGQPSR